MKRKNKRCPEYWSGLTDGIVIVLILCFVVFLVWFFFPEHEVFSKTEEYQEINSIIEKCSNKTIIESANCVNDITKVFFKNNLSNIENDIGFEVLKEEGGMCESWTSYWCEIGDKLGYHTKKISIDVGSVNLTYKGDYDEWNMGHMFCIWSSGDAYVIADGTNVRTIEFDGTFFEGEIIE